MTTLTARIGSLTHNQGVPGSSPGGPTTGKRAYPSQDKPSRKGEKSGQRSGEELEPVENGQPIGQP